MGPHASTPSHGGRTTPDTTRVLWHERTPRLINEPEEWYTRKHNCLLLVQSKDGRTWTGYVEARSLNSGRRVRVNGFDEAGSVEEAKALCEALADDYAETRGAA